MGRKEDQMPEQGVDYEILEEKYCLQKGPPFGINFVGTCCTKVKVNLRRSYLINMITSQPYWCTL